ncbi:DNA replication and repair protein RecR [Prevotella sp. ne3005]|uniref:recombination mediator RecR n=1 Tax=Prevotella sp. ne3005 TaxID=1761887 RepID=UPI0008D1A732|nr:recombination mediator RecR [Prevotella sp. ne3005]SEM63370.1 DNA replication and repair protein RecR [Prevotella sp. ne3005]
MIQQQYPSQLLEKAVAEFAKLPGVGRKTALRLVLWLLRQEDEETEQFAEAVRRLKQEVKYCKTCHNISDTDQCPICADPKRDGSLVCVVENIQDVMAIENTQQYHGLYHVLGGVISPMDGLGPSDIEIDSLVSRVAEGQVKEVILALSPTMEGDTTNFYIFRKLAGYEVKVSVIARGVSVGNELEYTDEVTLGRSIMNRTPFNSNE